MNFRPLTLVGISVFLLLASVGIFLFRTNDSSTPAFTNTDLPATTDAGRLVRAGFEAVSNQNATFRSQMTIRNADGTEFVGKIEHDGPNQTMRFEAHEDGEFVEYYLTPDFSILCEETVCAEVENDITDAFFDIKTFSYSTAELNALSDIMRYEGDQACGERECELWFSTESFTDVSTILIAKDNREVVELEGLVEDAEMRVTFDYTDVNIILPLNVERADPTE